MYTAEQVPDLAHELASLHELAQGMARPMGQPTAGWPVGSIEDKLGDYLGRARQLAAKFGPASMTIGVGIPFGAQISLTWNIEAEPEGGATVSFPSASPR